VFDTRYRNDETSASAYHPAALLKAVLLGYAGGQVSYRSIESACRENVVFMALPGDHAQNRRKVDAQWKLFALAHNYVRITCYSHSLSRRPSAFPKSCKPSGNLKRRAALRRYIALIRN